jgi:hypothetical protein
VACGGRSYGTHQFPAYDQLLQEAIHCLLEPGEELQDVLIVRFTQKLSTYTIGPANRANRPRGKSKGGMKEVRRQVIFLMFLSPVFIGKT